MNREEAWMAFWCVTTMVICFAAPFGMAEYCRRQDEKNKGRER